MVIASRRLPSPRRPIRDTGPVVARCPMSAPALSLTPPAADSGSAQWRRDYRAAAMSSADLLARAGLDRAALPYAIAETPFPVRVPPHFLSLIHRGDPLDPLLMQVLARADELRPAPAPIRLAKAALASLPASCANMAAGRCCSPPAAAPSIAAIVSAATPIMAPRRCPPARWPLPSPPSPPTPTLPRSSCRAAIR